MIVCAIGIPSLVIVDEKGALITLSGRQAIQHDPTGLDFPWHPKPLNELTQTAAVKLNENVCLILFTGTD
jgi:nucleoredoxin